jgi:hypothetical protein
VLVEVTWIVDYKVHVCVLFGMFYVLFRLLVVCVVGGPWWLVLFLEFPVVPRTFQFPDARLMPDLPYSDNNSEILHPRRVTAKRRV